jgi:hypothetical protein
MADERQRADTLATPDKTCRKPWQPSEPALGEALADPVVRTLMRADRVDPQELERKLRAMARKLAASGRPEAHWQAD